jgi:16S rRNA (adenine1518-N6/adenine1519-N6)-dimethyltransferase
MRDVNSRPNPKPRKRFGQNFLHDPGVIRRIIDAVDPQQEDHLVEIGPGQGAITSHLAARVDRLDVIEIDRDLAAQLAQEPWANKLSIHTQDALDFDFRQLSQRDRSLRLIGNLPYNISTPLLFHVLKQPELFIDVHVMLQKEVVRRMAAAPGSREYGRLTVALAAYCKVESLFHIGSGAFRPAPKVDSAFARLTPLTKPLLSNAEQPVFEQILRNAFGQRRKQLGNALSSIVTVDTIRAAGIDPELRAETLDVDQYVELTRQHITTTV